MGHANAIRKHLQGDPTELVRREELLKVLLDAFESGGETNVTSVLEARLEKLEEAFDQKLVPLNALLS